MTYRPSFKKTVIGLSLGGVLLASGAGATGHGLALLYEAACNENGAVLTFPNAEPPYNTIPMYLGKSCDAFSESNGAGRWYVQEEGGYAVELGSSITRFNFAEIPCDLPRCPA